MKKLILLGLLCIFTSCAHDEEPQLPDEQAQSALSGETVAPDYETIIPPLEEGDDPWGSVIKFNNLFACVQGKATDLHNGVIFRIAAEGGDFKFKLNDNARGSINDRTFKITHWDFILRSVYEIIIADGEPTPSEWVENIKVNFNQICLAKNTDEEAKVATDVAVYEAFDDSFTISLTPNTTGKWRVLRFNMREVDGNPNIQSYIGILQEP